MKSPVTIYVVHHPDCPEAGELASSLFHWFRLSYLSGETNSGAAGLPVYFRRQLSAHRFVPEIGFEDAELNVVILLVDHRMVAQPEWLQAVVDLAERVQAARERGGKHHAQLLPVALHESFYRTGPLYEGFNPIRLLDLTATEQLAVLRRSATEAIARVLRTDKQGNPQPLDVFLSHAKRDGKQIAEALRDGIRQVSQLVAWYDANDLPYGAAWESPMVKAAARGTAAMIATVTDAYPTRPWCRREAGLARTPSQIAKRGPGSRIWQVQPVVAVHRPQSGWARSIPMFESVSRIGWDELQQDGQIERIVDRLVLEVLLTRIHRKVAATLEACDKEKQRQLESCYLTWVPDAWTLSVIRQELSRKASRVRRIVYPGYGLTTAEQRELGPVISGFHKDTELISYEEAWQITDSTADTDAFPEEEPAEGMPRARLLIALSAGGDDKELAACGIGMEHVNELMVRISRSLLCHGRQLAFGGTLGDGKKELTRYLIETTQNWLEDGVAGECDVTKSETWPLVNYSAWPYHSLINEQQRANHVGVCHFVDVNPPGVPESTLSELLDDWKLKPQAQIHISNSLSEMRERSTRDSHLRIVWAGKIAGSSGWMPGILEEIGYSLTLEKPVLILGGYGGCAGLIADFLADPKSDWPEALSLNTEHFDLLSDSDRQALEERFAGIKANLTEYRIRLSDGESLNDLPADIAKKALTAQTGHTIAALAASAATTL